MAFPASDPIAVSNMSRWMPDTVLCGALSLFVFWQVSLNRPHTQTRHTHHTYRRAWGASVSQTPRREKRSTR